MLEFHRHNEGIIGVYTGILNAKWLKMATNSSTSTLSTMRECN